MGAELFHADGQTDIHDEVIVRKITTNKKKSRKITHTENRFSSQNHKNTNSQTKKNKVIRN